MSITLCMALCMRAHDAPVFKVDFPNLVTYKRAVKYVGLVQ